MARLPGLLLTGGESRRMGVDKAMLVVNGERLGERAARVLSSVCRPVVEVGPGRTALDSVQEQPRGDGPLAALVAGTNALDAAGPVIVVACDLPFVDAPMLRLLGDWEGDDSVVPVAADRPQLACARYGPAALMLAHASLHPSAEGERSLRRILDPRHTVYLPESVWSSVAPLHAFADLDQPSDLDRFGFDRGALEGARAHPTRAHPTTSLEP